MVDLTTIVSSHTLDLSLHFNVVGSAKSGYRYEDARILRMLLFIGSFSTPAG
jgi:hypothetical protein